MSKYFSNYPIIQYDGKLVRDITRRSKIVDDLLNDPYIFLPYTVRDGEKPEDIAFYYYGSVDDTWLVLLSNKITDPYTQWPLTDEDFDKYFIEKYGSISGRSGYDVIRWGQDQTRSDNIVYYYKEVDVDAPTDPNSYIGQSTTYLNVTEQQVTQLLDDQVIEVDGIKYRLVRE